MVYEVLSMEETTEQKIIRNIQGNFAVFKTPDVVGDKTMIPNIEWENTDEIDKFFMFAKNLGAKVIYLSEGEEEDEATGQVTTAILQVGFINQGIMHHINFVEDDDEDEDDEEEDEYEEDEESQVSPQQTIPQQTTPQQTQQKTQQAPQQTTQETQPSQSTQQQFGGPSNF